MKPRMLAGMRKDERIEVKYNLSIDAFERGKRKRVHEGHNIVVNTGRQFFCELITPSALGVGSFTRTQDTCIRYIGFGIGGTLQNSSDAAAPPYSVDYPGTNLQTDNDLTVARLERPVQVTAAPLWMQEISTPGTFPTATSTRFIATFGQTDLSFGAYTSVPLSEIALYKSDADPEEANGGAAAYPGPTGYIVAYDTFNTISKSGLISIQVQWDFLF